VWQDRTLVIHIVCFGNRHNSGLARSHSSVPQLIWHQEILPFVYLEKQMHHQWDEDARPLFAAAGQVATRAFADAQSDWPNLPLAIPLGPNVALFSQVSQQALLAAGKALGVPPTVGMRISRQVILRTIGAFDDIFAQHYPKEPRLGDQLARNNDRDTQPNQPDMQDPAPDLVGDTRAPVAPLDNTDRPTQ
jgi:hypothetical protein